jgi:2-hydroxycyclohexanecarboxyl-CoA dehydrogenase
MVPPAAPPALSEERVMPVAVVTGGASGMGRSICQHLARNGNPVAIVDANEELAQEVSKELQSQGARALACRADVSNRGDVDDAMQRARQELGPIGILVTSAGVAKFEPFAQITLESWNRVLAVNLTGTFHCVQSALPDMVQAEWGRIVLISSSSAQRGAPRMAHYASSKGGVIALAKTLALEFAPLGITVNNIAPSSIDTPMVHEWQAAGAVGQSDAMARHIPVGRVGTGDDIAAACAFLCSEEASYITGQTLSVNGGTYVT